MNLFGLTVRSPLVRAKAGYVDNPRWWHRVHEPYPGAWQQNVECDTTDAVLAFGPAYACATRIANDIATMPLQLVREDDAKIWNIVESNSPFWRPLRKPNNYQNRIQFFVTWLLSKLIRGNTYVLKQRDGRGMVVALYVLDPESVTCRWLPNGEVFYQLRRDELALIPDGVTVPASEIIHDLMNPLFHPLCGVSPLFACGLSATMGRRLQIQAATSAENHNVPSGVLTATTDLDDEQGEAWSRKWKENFSGKNRGNVAILGNGLKYEKISFSASESQTIELLKQSAQDVASAFGIPAHKIGAGPVPPVGNADAMNTQYYNDTLKPLIEAIELCMDEGLGLGPTFPQNADMGTEFDVNNLWRLDTGTQIDMLTKSVSSFMKVDEARLQRNLPPVKGGDQVYLQQQNFSLEALAKRDAKPDPFGTTPAAPVAEPAPPDPEAEKNALIAMRVEINRIAKAAIGLETQ